MGRVFNTLYEVKPINRVAAKGLNYDGAYHRVDHEIDNEIEKQNDKRKAVSQFLKKHHLRKRSPLLFFVKRIMLMGKLPKLFWVKVDGENKGEECVYQIMVKFKKGGLMPFNLWAKRYGYRAVDTKGDEEFVKIRVRHLKSVICGAPSALWNEIHGATPPIADWTKTTHSFRIVSYD